MKKTSRSKKNAGTVKKVLGYLKAYRLLFVISLILALCVTALTLYIPILVGQAIDMAVDAGKVNFDGIYAILLHIGIVAVITCLRMSFIFQFLTTNL